MRGRGTFVTGLSALALIGCLAVTAEAAPATQSSITVPSPIGGRLVGLPASSAATSSSKLLLLPKATTPPVDVPYGIGKTLYLNGHAYDQTARWAQLLTNGRQADAREFSAVQIAWGTVVFTIRDTPGCAGPCYVFGRLAAGGQASSVGGAGFGLAATSGGALASVGCPDDPFGCGQVGVFTPRGRSIPPAFNAVQLPIGGNVGVQAAGGTFVIQSPTSVSPTETPIRSFALYPGLPATGLPFDDTYGVGQGPGWLATKTDPASVCYRIAALASARTLRARICSQTLPVVNDDGTKAVVVQAGHVRLYDTRTGAQINATASPNGPGYEPFAWESPDRYLVYAGDETGTLVIMRCFVNRLCRRAVTAHTAAGVTQIVRGGQMVPFAPG